jgi:Cu-Zn family superoxide dismutase
MSRLAVIVGVLCLTVLGNASAVGAEGERATGALRDGAGTQIGDVRLEQTASGVQVTVSGQRLTPGQHGVHFHAVGRCEGPAFTSAGGHFNPISRKHGLQNPEGPHGGDLPNLQADNDGKTLYTATTDRISLTAGPSGIFDADGTALVIHAGQDDQMTDPAGNSGDRVACAILTLSGPVSMPRTGAGGAGWQGTPFMLAGMLLVIGALALAARRRPM